LLVGRPLTRGAARLRQRASRLARALGSVRRSQRHRLHHPWRGLFLIGCVLALLWPTARLFADAASGTYTGSMSLRSNYYFERSTRVISPTAALSLDTPSGVRVQGAYLVDAITSASQATGIIADSSFTEIRHEASGGLGYEFDLGKVQLDLSANGRYSHEPDYLSRGGGFAAALSMNQRATVLSFNGYLANADVGRVIRSTPIPGSDKLVATRRVSVGMLNVLSLGMALDQVLSKNATLTLGIDVAYLDGFQANPYRIVAFANGGAAAEHHPDQRIRQAYYLWFAQFLPRTRSTLRLGYRLYHDNWDILAHVPEARVYQELGRYVELRLRYRYYTQSSSFFYRKTGNLSADHYITADPKMSQFQDQTVGARLRIDLDFLAFTALDALHTAAFDFGVEYIFNTNRYGNGLVGQGGLVWSF
jgi:hypothetical protein